MKTLFGIFLCALTCVLNCLAGSITLVWDQNTEPDIGSYHVWQSANGGGFLPTPVPFPTHQYTYTNVSAGNSYQFYVTAVNTNQLESVPSAILSFSPPPPPPPLNVQKVIVSGVTGSSWTGVQVFFDTVNLTTYQATNYFVTATSAAGGTVSISAAASPAIFPLLAIQSYTFSAILQNASGTSPTASTVFLSGVKPVAPANVKIQTGP